MWYYVFGTVFRSSSHVLFVVNSHKMVYGCVMKVFAKDLTTIMLIFILLLSCLMYVKCI
jgi:hypothetical protein